MVTDTAVEPDADGDAEVMASVEEGPIELLVIADVTRDDAYITVPLADAATLAAWR